MSAAGPVVTDQAVEAADVDLAAPVATPAAAAAAARRYVADIVGVAEGLIVEIAETFDSAETTHGGCRMPVRVNGRAAGSAAGASSGVGVGVERIAARPEVGRRMTGEIMLGSGRDSVLVPYAASLHHGRFLCRVGRKVGDLRPQTGPRVAAHAAGIVAPKASWFVPHERRPDLLRSHHAHFRLRSLHRRAPRRSWS